jgi:hypothetical protein
MNEIDIDTTQPSIVDFTRSINQTQYISSHNHIQQTQRHIMSTHTHTRARVHTLTHSLSFLDDLHARNYNYVQGWSSHTKQQNI